MDTLVINGNNPVAITFNAPITDVTVNALVGCMMTNVNDGIDEIVLMMSTPGGSVSAGLSAYNAIRSIPSLRLVTYNLGAIASIGNVIYQAGNQRISATNARFMLHGVSVSINQTMRLSDLEHRRDDVQSSQDSIINILEARSNYSTQKLSEMFLGEKWLRADEALDSGLTDEVADIRLPNGVPFIPIVFGKNSH